MTFTDHVRQVKPLDDGIVRILGISSPPLTYPRSPRGQYLRAFREALGLTMNSAHKVLDVGLAAYTGLESGSCVFTDRTTWARAELALIAAAGPGWCGIQLHDYVAWVLHRLKMLPTWKAHLMSTEAEVGLVASLGLRDFAACQIHTVKRGILYRLAGALALEVGDTGDAVRLARAGFNIGGDAIGSRPEWLETGLQMLIAEAVTTAPSAAEAST